MKVLVSIGFSICPAQPAANARSRSCGIAYAVSATTGTDCSEGSAFSSRVAS
jgi:hypothetical protein